MNGILVINKPQGWTSHDVVNKVRGILREKKVGHTGTLDPLATGVLVLCVGKATKLVRYLEADDKEYTASLKLGVTTETQDSEGRILETRQYAAPSREQVQNALSGFQGGILQRPPAFSAVKVGGIPSYRLARKGTIRQHDERPVTIHAINLIEYADPAVRFSVHCSKGTYIRTLCADMGERLGTGAHLTALVRTRAGRFRLEQAVTLEQVTDKVSRGQIERIVMPLDEAIRDLSSLTVNDSDARRIVHGNVITVPAGFDAGASRGLVQIITSDGRLLAVAKAAEGRIRPEVVLA